MSTVAEGIAGIIQRLAEIDNELESRGANALLKEKDHLRDLLKDQLTREGRLDFVDEVSGMQAIITDTHQDEWDADKLVACLPRPELALEVIVNTVDGKRVRELIKEGAIAESELVEKGALRRKLRARQLKLQPYGNGVRA